MADDATKTAADNTGGLTADAVQQMIADALKPVTEQLGKTAETLKGLGDNQKVLADTLKELPPAPAEGSPADGSPADGSPAGGSPAGGKKGDGKATAAGVPTAGDIQKLVADGIAAALKERDDAAGKTAARQATIDKLVAEKLGGDAELAALLTGDTDEQLAAQAEALGRKISPDFGGAAKSGGKTPNATDAPKPIGVLSEGTQKFADSLDLGK